MPPLGLKRGGIVKPQSPRSGFTMMVHTVKLGLVQLLWLFYDVQMTNGSLEVLYLCNFPLPPHPMERNFVEAFWQCSLVLTF